MQVDTVEGPARVHSFDPVDPVDPVDPARAAGRLVLGHGAGGGIAARDLRAATAAANAAGWQVLLVEQPWLVAGRRVATAPPRLDAAWLDVLRAVEAGRAAGPLVVGGRSAGARVACRTAAATTPDAVCCLAFPLHPPGRPDRSRASELAGAGVPVLVVQGSRDPFGTAADVVALGLPGVHVVEVDADHRLAATGQVSAAVTAWLATLNRLRSRG